MPEIKRRGTDSRQKFTVAELAMLNEGWYRLDEAIRNPRMCSQGACFRMYDRRYPMNVQADYEVERVTESQLIYRDPEDFTESCYSMNREETKNYLVKFWWGPQKKADGDYNDRWFWLLQVFDEPKVCAVGHHFRLYNCAKGEVVQENYEVVEITADEFYYRCVGNETVYGMTMEEMVDYLIRFQKLQCVRRCNE